MQFPKKLTASGNVLVLLSLMYFITYVDRVNISTAAPAIKGEFGLSNTELGLVFSAFAYPYVCSRYSVVGWATNGGRGLRSFCAA
jgi:sugar phosphate permease